jgi:hypothetical protein
MTMVRNVSLVVLFVACDAGHPGDHAKGHPGDHATGASSSRAALEYGSADDVASILRANGVPPPPLNCTNVSYASDPTHGAIRTVACTLALDAAPIATLTEQVPLQPGEAFHGPPDYAGSCGTKPGLGTADTKVLVGDNKKVTNGVGRVELHVVPGHADACIEITYPWSE